MSFKFIECHGLFNCELWHFLSLAFLLFHLRFSFFPLHLYSLAFSRKNVDNNSYQVMDDRWESEVSEFGAINITGFRIVDDNRRYVREFLDGWKRLDPATSVGAGKESISVSPKWNLYVFFSYFFSLLSCCVAWFRWNVLFPYFIKKKKSWEKKRTTSVCAIYHLLCVLFPRSLYFHIYNIIFLLVFLSLFLQ